jgi:hypothetical protein
MIMTELSIPGFLASGHLGPIHLGMPERDVRAALGEPTDTGGTSKKYRRPTIWRYGKNIEIIFAPEQRAVMMILVDFWGSRDLSAGSSLLIASGGIVGGMLREQFLDLLSLRKLRHEEKKGEGDTARIVVENRVSAIFGTDDRLVKLIAS